MGWHHTCAERLNHAIGERDDVVDLVHGNEQAHENPLVVPYRSATLCVLGFCVSVHSTFAANGINGGGNEV